MSSTSDILDKLSKDLLGSDCNEPSPNIESNVYNECKTECESEMCDNKQEQKQDSKTKKDLNEEQGKIDDLQEDIADLNINEEAGLDAETKLEMAQEKAKNLIGHLTAEQKKQQLKNFLDKSIHFADKVLKRFISMSLKKSIPTLFDQCMNTTGELILMHKSSVNPKYPNKKRTYKLYLDIVNKDYMLDLGVFSGDKSVARPIQFLLECAQILFGSLKKHVERAGYKLPGHLMLDQNTTLYIDESAKKRIGVKIMEITGEVEGLAYMRQETNNDTKHESKE